MRRPSCSYLFLIVSASMRLEVMLQTGRLLLQAMILLLQKGIIVPELLPSSPETINQRVDDHPSQASVQ